MLFQEYYLPLVKFAEGILFDADDSKDIVQNLFVHLWENAKDIEINTSIKGYLFQATRNRCLNRIKSLRIEDNRNILYLEGVLNSEVLDPEMDSGETGRIMDALGSLPDKMREIFKMKYLENQRQKEIADILGITENTVKTQLLRAKKKLRDILY